MPKPSKKKPERKFVPHKVDGMLIGAWINEDGKVVGEEQIGRVVLYEPEFAQLPAKVKEIWPEAEKLVKEEKTDGPTNNRR